MCIDSKYTNYKVYLYYERYTFTDHVVGNQKTHMTL